MVFGCSSFSYVLLPKTPKPHMKTKQENLKVILKLIKTQLYIQFNYKISLQ